MNAREFMNAHERRSQQRDDYETLRRIFQDYCVAEHPGASPWTVSVSALLDWLNFHRVIASTTICNRRGFSRDADEPLRVKGGAET
jgi:hypothetical protein